MHVLLLRHKEFSFEFNSARQILIGNFVIQYFIALTHGQYDVSLVMKQKVVVYGKKSKRYRYAVTDTNEPEKPY
jgi:hypothetical protein